MTCIVLLEFTPFGYLNCKLAGVKLLGENKFLIHISTCCEYLLFTCSCSRVSYEYILEYMAASGHGNIGYSMHVHQYFVCIITHCIGTNLLKFKPNSVVRWHGVKEENALVPVNVLS